MQKRYIVSIVFFIIPIVFFFLYSMFDKDLRFSDAENRELATAPKISANGYTSGALMKNFEQYYNDQFPMRNAFLSAAKKYNSLMFPTTLIKEDEGVIVGKRLIHDGRITEIFKVSDDTAKRYANILNTLYNECGQPDTYVLIPPPAFNVYAPEKYIDETTDFTIALDTLSKSLNGPKLVDVSSAFEKNKAEYLYFRTDHHWTATGAYYACKEFLKVAEGEVLPPLSEYRSGVREGFYGSLYNAIKTDPASELLENSVDSVEYFYPRAEYDITIYIDAVMSFSSKRELFYPDYNETTNLYSVYMGGDIALGHISTGTKNGKSICVVRDSYGHAFIPFLIDAYEDIYLIEPRYFDASTNKIELGKFFIEHEIDTLLFLGYPHMSVGEYWDTMSNYLEEITNLPD